MPRLIQNEERMLDNQASTEMNRLAEGELHLLKIKNDWFCFDVEHPYDFHKLENGGEQLIGEGDEFTGTIHLYDDLEDYQIEVFWYPEKKEGWLQLYKDKSLTWVDQTERAETDFTVSKVKKPAKTTVIINDTTIVKGIICKKCDAELPPMTVKDHLDGNFSHTCT